MFRDMCVYRGWGFLCVCVGGRGEVLGYEGERLKFNGHALFINEFAVENLFLSG